MAEEKNLLESTANRLFQYLKDVIYNPSNASLDIADLPEEFRNFGKGLVFYVGLVAQTTSLAKELANGNLDCELPSSGNEIAASMKNLHASLKHLTWQAQRVANGDYKQHVDFMGDFSEAFNNMIKQLERRQKIEQAEKSRLERYVHLMLANCPDPILLFDRQGNVAYVSDSYFKSIKKDDELQIYGKPVDELFASVVSKEFLEYIEDMFRTALLEKRTIKTEQVINFGNSNYLQHYQIQVTPMLDENDDSEGIMMFLYDTTEIVNARILAEQSLKEKTDFLARMSHEMRTPMNAIIGMTTIFSVSDDHEEKNYCINKINEASQHLLGVINDILDMSSIEANKIEILPMKFDFAKMIERVEGLVQFRIKENKQSFTIEFDPEIPQYIISDEQRLTQVIANLITNSIKFTPENGSISLLIEKLQDISKSPDILKHNTDCDEYNEKGILRITVKDTGIGISKDKQKRMFEAFEQIDGGISRKYGGIGLGLTISKRIIDMMNGRIWVESEENKGASFIFEIPVEYAENIAENSNDNALESESDKNIFSGKRILVADDIEINREIICSLLEDTGVTIDSAQNGAEAVEMFESKPDGYDLILMDIHMPGMDGYEATRKIRSSKFPRSSTIPIVAMTANVFREDVEKCIECGMNSHLGKPIDIDEVIVQLKEYLFRKIH